MFFKKKRKAGLSTCFRLITIVRNIVIHKSLVRGFRTTGCIVELICSENDGIGFNGTSNSFIAIENSCNNYKSFVIGVIRTSRKHNILAFIIELIFDNIQRAGANLHSVIVEFFLGKCGLC